MSILLGTQFFNYNFEVCFLKFFLHIEIYHLSGTIKIPVAKSTSEINNKKKLLCITKNYCVMSYIAKY